MIGRTSLLTILVSYARARGSTVVAETVAELRDTIRIQGVDQPLHLEREWGKSAPASRLRF